MRRIVLFFTLALLSLSSARADEILPFQAEALAARLGSSTWELIKLGEVDFSTGPSPMVIHIQEGRLTFEGPCGTFIFPAPDPLPEQDTPAEPLPCIAIHTSAYDVAYILSEAEEATLSSNGTLIIAGRLGEVVLRPLGD